MSDAKTESQAKVSQFKANPTLTIPESLDAINHERDLEMQRENRKDSSMEVEADAYTPNREDVQVNDEPLEEIDEEMQDNTFTEPESADGDKKTDPAETIPETVKGDDYPFKETEAQFFRNQRVSQKPIPVPSPLNEDE